MNVFVGKYCEGCYKLRSKVTIDDERYIGSFPLHSVYCKGCGGGWEH